MAIHLNNLHILHLNFLEEIPQRYIWVVLHRAVLYVKKGFRY